MIGPAVRHRYSKYMDISPFVVVLNKTHAFRTEILGTTDSKALLSAIRIFKGDTLSGAAGNLIGKVRDLILFENSSFSSAITVLPSDMV